MLIQKRVRMFIDWTKRHGFMKMAKLSFNIATGRYKRDEEINTLYYFLNHCVDITKMPPAQGTLREAQICNVVLLGIFDDICRKRM